MNPALKAEQSLHAVEFVERRMAQACAKHMTLASDRLDP